MDVVFVLSDGVLLWDAGGSECMNGLNVCPDEIRRGWRGKRSEEKEKIVPGEAAAAADKGEKEEKRKVVPGVRVRDGMLCVSAIRMWRPYKFHSSNNGISDCIVNGAGRHSSQGSKSEYLVPPLCSPFSCFLFPS